MTVIRVENIGKRYRVGALEGGALLRDRIAETLRHPLRALRPKRKETFWALKDISFEVQEGEVLGLIGRNGAGKSTLLKILSRITKPTVGHAEIHGRVGSLLEVGTGFHPELSGRENVFLNGAILGMRRREIVRKFDEIVAFAEVEKFIDTPVKHYSSGMYIRLAFAVAAHLETEILFVDEVLSVGDVSFQKKCLGKMDDVAHHGRTVLFVSHNMGAMRSIARRCLLVEEGGVARDGDVTSVVQQYLCRGLAELPVRVDATDWPRSPEADGTDLRIVEARICSANGEARIQAESSLAVEVLIRVRRRVEQLQYGFAVFSLEGTRLFQCHNTNEGRPFPLLEPGEYRIRAEVPRVPLPPGRYRLDWGVRCESKGLDWLQDFMQFEVEETRTPESVWLKPYDGLVRQASVWSKPEIVLESSRVPVLTKS